VTGEILGPATQEAFMQTIRFVLALTALTIGASPARAALELIQPARWTVQLPAGMADLEEQLRKAHFARVDVDGRSVVVRTPRVTPEGLAYESIDGFPTHRPAIIVGADWDSIPVRPNPIPWDDIDQIEAGFQDRTWGVILGGAAGLLGGFYLGAWSVDSRSEKSQMLVGPAICAAGAGLGALLLPITYWKQVYP
jgi:hypothetical protein